jgi:GAF domain-containing protein
MRRSAKTAKDKVGAKPPVARKSPRSEGSRVHDLEKRLAEALKLKTEALEQQTATSEILRVISSFPSNLQPLMNVVAENAARVCGAADAVVYRLEGGQLQLLASYGDIPAMRSWPLLDRGHVSGRAVIDRRPVHVHDIVAAEAEFPISVALARQRGTRTYLSTPLLRDGLPVGVIGIRRQEVRPFTDRQIELLQTFADQAVIAIENVRLFTELKEKNHALTQALEQQTATSEILRVISSSPTDVQPVFDAIVRSAVRLCDGLYGFVGRFDGEQIHIAAHHNYTPDALRVMQEMYPMRPSRQLVSGRVILTRSVVQIEDLMEDPEYAQRLARAGGWRASLGVPLLREGNAIGMMTVMRGQPGPFSETQVELLKTFADQAVIAIENVRLFTELQSSNRELRTALDKQTATSDILRVISQSQTDVQPVFDAILASAVRLLRGYSGLLSRITGDQIELAAMTSTNDAGNAAARAAYPHSLQSEEPHAQVIRDRVPLNIADSHTDLRLPEATRVYARARGYRSWVVVPILHHDEAVGAIGVTRREPGGFNDNEIALLKTFADQAVIAIENVRLFTALQEKNGALTQAHAQVIQALEQQTATSEILRVISTSPTDTQPVFDSIVQNAVRLLAGFSGVVTRLVEGQLHLAALTSTSPTGDAAQKALWPKPLTEDRFLHGQVITTLEPRFIIDVESDPSVPSEEVVVARARGYRSIIAVPLVREARAVGSMTVTRRTPGPFSDSEIALLKTFADQAVIAIENVRLFTELQTRTQELTRSVGQLTALGEVGQAVSSTLDLETVLSTIVSRAIQLSGTDGGSVYEYDEVTEEFSLRASRDLPEAYVEQVRDARPRKGEGAVGRVARTRAPVQIVDIADTAAYESRVRNMLLQIGLRALLAVPLIAEDRLVGALIVMRKRPGTFAAEEVALLQTFATQSALAIQNARLFREIEEKSRQLEVASQHKSEFLANMSHELRTPLNAIIGFSEVLTDRMFGELNEKQEEYLKDIYASGTHLLSLINDILDLSKIEAGRMELELSVFDLPTALDNALTLVRERAGRRSITLQISVDERLGEVRADERKIRQVVLNLLSNAIKFTPEGGRIEVRAVPKDGSVEVSVSDTGVGIAPEDQDAIFEEFRQVGTAAKKVEGTGLGLTLCRKFIELHGGRIWVKSQVGVGSTFTFTIPEKAEGGA